jgi:phage baseplate assembly protein gpV
MSDHLDALARAFAPQSEQNREQKVFGVVTARVDRIEDDGTYRLKLFGMNGQDGDDHSAPARVMAPMAGGGRGVHFFPEKGDEVVVAFQHGDTNTPIILGGVWNRADTPPAQARQSADNDVRTIVSRSGHELTFDDSEGATKVTLRSQGGQTVVLDDAPGGAKVTVATRGGRKVILDDTAPGALIVETPSARITLREPGVVEIQASTSITLSAPVIALSGSAVSVGAGVGTATIDGSPYKLHTHPLSGPVPGMTGPVVP